MCSVAMPRVVSVSAYRNNYMRIHKTGSPAPFITPSAAAVKTSMPPRSVVWQETFIRRSDVPGSNLWGQGSSTCNEPVSPPLPGRFLGLVKAGLLSASSCWLALHLWSRDGKRLGKRCRGWASRSNFRHNVRVHHAGHVLFLRFG